ncbi:MAG: AI-2E family transporter [Alphaproteobacteria bacterium]|nr:AI-2E family transporter [Alphaproteobacteria bacterium]
MIFNNSRSRFWLIIFALFVLIVWALKPMLLPFVAALILSYFLNPAVNLACRVTRLPRWLGTILILATFIMIAVIILLLIAPVLQSQIGMFMDALPGYIDDIRASIIPWAERWLTKLPPDGVDKLRDAAGQYAGNVMGWSGKLIKSIVSGGVAIFDILMLVVITPVVSFYLLRDWPKLTETVDALLPRKNYTTIRKEMTKIDNTLSGFIRGQALVCICLGMIYGIGLTIVGLKYGATIGVVAGLLSFIPYAGSTFCLVSSMALAFVQFDNVSQIVMTFSVFLVGQSLEGYVLTPKLVGDRVGLHPVWILFALFAGASLFGFMGVLIAVPVAAVIGVLIRFVLRQYKVSSVYRDPLAPTSIKKPNEA